MRALAFAVLLTGPGLAGGTLHVPRDHATIQAAVDAASSGDTVLVAPGTYHETVVVDGKDLVLRSLAGPAVTVIDADDQGTVVQLLNGADGSLEGFTITDGFASFGGGIVVNGSSPHVVGCRVEQNGATSDGGGIWVNDGSPTITNCIVRHNGCVYWDGGGIWLANAQGTRIAHCTIVENTIPFDGWGPGIWDHHGGVTISNCIVRDNLADWHEWDIGAHPDTRVQYSNYGESQGTHGNIDKDPNFVDQAGGDFHLRRLSPCRGAGLPGAPGALDHDLDGNVRGASVDIGADEYGPAAYLLGRLEPGQPVTVRAGGGQQGDVALVWLDTGLRSVPLATPFGPWWLETRRVKAHEDALGFQGWSESTWLVPPGVPSGTVLHAQGLVATTFTPLSSTRVE